MKPLFVIPFIILSNSVLAQFKVTPLNKKDIPATIHFAGHIVDAVNYTDKDGDHIMITTETGIVSIKDKAGYEYWKADLYAYNYKNVNGALTLDWQMHDLTIECPVEVKAAYIPGTFAITDLDKNDTAEVWLMYTTSCRGDVSPSNMKIIMHEGSKKYAVRGESKVDVGNKQYYGGAYKLDDAFKNGPKAFGQYAIGLWNKNIMEKW